MSKCKTSFYANPPIIQNNVCSISKEPIDSHDVAKVVIKCIFVKTNTAPNTDFKSLSKFALYGKPPALSGLGTVSIKKCRMAWFVNFSLFKNCNHDMTVGMTLSMVMDS